jgi:pimeloyl-ACP methyl ester carboxylesterase
MYYETYGSGPPLLLIHGNGGSIWGMRCQISYFSPSYRAIAADSRAHGKTEDGSDRLTYEQMADDLAGLLSEIKVNSAEIIGQSDGAILALLLAIRHPSKVKKIVANSPNLRPDDTALAAWALPLMQKALGQANAMIAKGDLSRNWLRIKRWNELMLNEPHMPTADHLLAFVRNLGKAEADLHRAVVHVFGKTGAESGVDILGDAFDSGDPFFDRAIRGHLRSP